MKDRYQINERFKEVDCMCHKTCSDEISNYLRGYSEALEWVLELE